MSVKWSPLMAVWKHGSPHSFGLKRFETVDGHRFSDPLCGACEGVFALFTTDDGRFSPREDPLCIAVLLHALGNNVLQGATFGTFMGRGPHYRGLFFELLEAYLIEQIPALAEATQ